ILRPGGIFEQLATLFLGPLAIVFRQPKIFGLPGRGAAQQRDQPESGDSFFHRDSPKKAATHRCAIRGCGCEKASCNYSVKGGTFANFASLRLCEKFASHCLGSRKGAETQSSQRFSRKLGLALRTRKNRSTYFDAIA